MRIDEVRCDQFAGVLDRSISFDKGLNLVIGANESGKSTMVDLLYYLFFQDSMIDGRRDKEFKDKYFPKTVGAFQGDTIDGTVRFTGKNGSYKLSKEWSGKNGSSRLMLPDGTTVRDGKTVSKILDEELVYGKGIYDEFVFASQKRIQTALQSLLGTKASDAVTELAGTISKAVMETGGIDVERMQAELDSIIKAYDGHWDFLSDMPEGGRKRSLSNRWKNGAGQILEAYYALEEVRQLRDEAEKAERAYESASEQLQKCRKDQADEEARQREFNEVRAKLEQKYNLTALVAKNNAELRSAETARKNWPEASDKLGKAVSIKDQLDKARKKHLFDSVSVLQMQLAEKRKELNKTGKVEKKDIEQAEKYSRNIDRLEAKLSGVRLQAKITPLGYDEVTVRSLATGEVITRTYGHKTKDVPIKEAVSIEVPDVVSIQLVPSGVDIEKMMSDLQDNKDNLSFIFEKYDVNSYYDLRRKMEAGTELQKDCDLLTLKINNALQGIDLESLKLEVLTYPEDLPSVEELESSTRKLCGAEELGAFIGAQKRQIDSYQEVYSSEEKLSEIIAGLHEECERLNMSLATADDIPVEYELIGDPDQYAKHLQDNIEKLKRNTDDMVTVWSNAFRALGDVSAEEYTEELRQRQQEFEEQKSVCAHWKHIQDVFLRLKAEMKGNPTAGIESAFQQYLSAMSNDSITLEGMTDSLNTTLVSGRHPLTVEILSEGTKDTVSLAFRLAVLEHLYPDGGAVAVLDDPFTDMDPERVEEACKLVQKFAERNQVIFVTCDDKYRKLLEGNTISIEKR